jgi:aminomethyltransferase
MLTESEPHYARPLLKTPFHERARELSQLDSFIPWAGYTTVDVFTSVEQEYFAIRNSSSLYDLTPMVKYRIAGPDALRFLDRLTTREMRKVGPGKVAYAVWCDDEGHLIDDGTVFCRAANEYRLCTAERQLDWFQASAIGFDVEIREVTEDIAALAVQGPTSARLLRAAGLAGVERLKPFEHGDFTLLRPAGGGAAGGGTAIPVMVSRTGFTGDLGYELWMAPVCAEAVWDALMAAGRNRAVRPVGSRALNIARIEAGFLLPNVDFVSAAHTLYLGTERSPLELGLAWLVDFGKGHFTGRRALLAEQRRGPRRQLVGLDVDGNKPAHNALLYADASGRRQVGSVTSATWSPTAKRNIALAIVDAPHFEKGATLWADIYLNRELVWERRMVRARVVERPFFAPQRRRATPPADF